MTGSNATPSEITTRTGRCLLLIAAVLWSSSGLLVKCGPMQAIPVEFRGPLVACYRVLFAAAVMAPFVSWRRVRFRPALVGMALCYASMNVLFVTALTRTTAAAAIFLQYTSTAWAFLLGIVVLRERADRGSGTALAFALCGIAWIIAAEWQGEHLAGNLIALASGLSYAGVVIGLRALRGEQAAWLVFLNSIIGGMVLLPWVWTFDVSLDTVQWTVIGVIGVLQMGVPYLLFAVGVRAVQASEAALITLLEAVLNPIWVWMFLSEVAPLSTWTGGLLILAGLVVRYTLFAPRG
ncbi:MAG: DMT family transporter [Planctomycetaceae bacterium]